LGYGCRSTAIEYTCLTVLGFCSFPASVHGTYLGRTDAREGEDDEEEKIRRDVLVDDLFDRNAVVDQEQHCEQKLHAKFAHKHVIGNQAPKLG